MFFADLHIHALFGVDDGAKTEAEMKEIIDASYLDGIRELCVTPHFHPGYFGENRSRTEKAIIVLKEYIEERYPDLNLYSGNELRYDDNCTAWLNSEICHTLNDTRFVLVDFSASADRRTIVEGLESLLNAGYRPVLAHVERYRSLWAQTKLLQKLHDNGVLLQMDTCSPFGGFGYRVKLQSVSYLSERLIDLVGSDSHDMTHRPPGISKCFQYIQRKFGSKYAEDLCYNNALRLLTSH